MTFKALTLFTLMAIQAVACSAGDDVPAPGSDTGMSKGALGSTGKDPASDATSGKATQPEPQPLPPVPACDSTSCGPRPLHLAVQCSDGSTADVVCEYVPDSQRCGWVQQSCPENPPTCDPNACGPRPLVASRICKDGSTAGPECVPSKAGTCGWIITSCP